MSVSDNVVKELLFSENKYKINGKCQFWNVPSPTCVTKRLSVARTGEFNDRQILLRYSLEN